MPAHQEPEPLRNTRSNNGTLIQPATPRRTIAAAQITLAFDDNRLASMLFGQYGQNLALIERRLGVVADQRGNHVTIVGLARRLRAGAPRARGPL